jgi:hypothetical protein
VFYLYTVHFSRKENRYLVNEEERGRTCTTNEAKRNAYRILVAKPEGKRPLGRLKLMWVGNIKIDIREREYGMVLTGSIWLRIGASRWLF